MFCVDLTCPRCALVVLLAVGYDFDRTYGWEVIIFGRKFLMALIVFLIDDPTLQSSLLLLLCMTALALQLLFLPFEKAYVDQPTAPMT